MIASWAGLDEAAWHLPGAAPSDAGGPDWSLAEHVGHIADWQELAIDYVGTRDPRPGRGRPTTTTTAATSIASTSVVGRPGRRCRSTTIRRPPRRAPGRASSSWPARLPRRDDPQRRGLGLGLRDAARPLSGPSRRHRAVGRCSCVGRQDDGDPFVADPRAADHDGFLADAREIDATFDDLIRRLPVRAMGLGRGLARLDGSRPRRPPRRLDGRGRPCDRGPCIAGRLARRSGRRHRRLERASRRGHARDIAGGHAPAV